MVPLVLAQLSEVDEGAGVCGFQGECLLQGCLRRLRVGVHLQPRQKRVVIGRARRKPDCLTRVELGLLRSPHPGHRHRHEMEDLTVLRGQVQGGPQ